MQLFIMFLRIFESMLKFVYSIVQLVLRGPFKMFIVSGISTERWFHGRMDSKMFTTWPIHQSYYLYC